MKHYFIFYDPEDKNYFYGWYDFDEKVGRWSHWNDSLFEILSKPFQGDLTTESKSIESFVKRCKQKNDFSLLCLSTGPVTKQSHPELFI